jgi:hypothetical protein
MHPRTDNPRCYFAQAVNFTASVTGFVVSLTCDFTAKFLEELE